MGASKIGCSDLSLVTAGQLHTQGGIGAVVEASTDLAHALLHKTPLLLYLSDDIKSLVHSFLGSEDLAKPLFTMGENGSATPLAKALCGTSFELEQGAPLTAKDVRSVFEEFSAEYKAIITSPLSRTEMHPWVHELLRSALYAPKLPGEPRPAFPNHKQDVLLALARGCVNVMHMDCEKHKINLQQAVSGLPAELAASLKEMLNQLNAERPEDMQKNEDFKTLTRLLGKYKKLVDLRNSMLMPDFEIGNLKELSKRLGGDEDLMMLALPDNPATRAKVMAEVERDDWMLESVPHTSEAVVMAALRQDGWALQFVPEDSMTEAMVMAAVEQNGRALDFVPDALKTEAVVMAAVKQHGWALQFVPDALKTEEMVMAAVKRDGSMLQYVPNALKTEAVVMAAVKQDGRALQFVPDALKTEEMVMAAVKEDGIMLQYVPNALNTEAVVMAAVRQHGYALRYIPDALKTEEMVVAAVKQHGWALQFVPDALKTEEMVMAAVKQDVRVLQFVPEHLRSRWCLPPLNPTPKGLTPARQCCNVM